ncbi:M28 family metallopeptidase [bacterium]|nr:M28 family metallopeptidase [bacterium]
MLTNPMGVLRTYPVRKTKKQKQAFRDAVEAYASSAGYPCRVERGSFGCRNLILGDPESARYLVTAHYDTCARLPFPNFITPCNFLPFLGYQLLVVVLLLFTAFAVGVLAGFAASSVDIGSAVGYLSIWVLLGLMFAGPANPSNANDNTSGVVTLLEIARTLPENQRHKVCFVLFDLEEAGLLGSASYRKAHRKATDSQLVLNLDCVGDGDHIRLFPTHRLKKDRKKLTSLYLACGYFGKKDVLVHEKGFSVYPSDQANFPWGVGICALRKGKAGLYLSRIHTRRDTVLDETNVNILRAALTTFLCRDAAQ